MTITGTIHTKVVGLTFQEGYPESVLSEAPDFPTKEVAIRREPENPYDSNAIAVYMGESQLGHLPKDLAHLLAPEMDASVGWEVNFAEVVVSPENPTFPGVSLLLTYE